jgi:F420-0:gamma-glutamyl ligase
MGETSQAFLNTVPDNPAAAADLTTGQLRDQGPQALAQGYSDVAYFEVKNVYIDQDEGYTINTVEVTHDDGTKTIERRTLTFGEDNKIQNDGR